MKRYLFFCLLSLILPALSSGFNCPYVDRKSNYDPNPEVAVEERETCQNEIFERSSVTPCVSHVEFGEVSMGCLTFNHSQGMFKLCNKAKSTLRMECNYTPLAIWGMNHSREGWGDCCYYSDKMPKPPHWLTMKTREELKHPWWRRDLRNACIILIIITSITILFFVEGYFETLAVNWWMKKYRDYSIGPKEDKSYFDAKDSMDFDKSDPQTPEKGKKTPLMKSGMSPIATTPTISKWGNLRERTVVARTPVMVTMKKPAVTSPAVVTPKTSATKQKQRVAKSSTPMNLNSPPTQASNRVPPGLPVDHTEESGSKTDRQQMIVPPKTNPTISSHKNKENVPKSTSTQNTQVD